MSQPEIETIAVVGLWHLGSVLSACLVSKGHRVIGMDSSETVVHHLNQGSAPLFEPGLDTLIRAGRDSKLLEFSNDLNGVAKCSTVFIAFDTPVDDDDNSDMTFLDDAILKIAPLLRQGAIIIVSSQVPVGTCSRWSNEIAGARGSNDISVTYSPENLQLGNALESWLRPARIVLGADSSAAADRATALFSCVDAPIIVMSVRSAEMSKHALNAFLASSVSFINEVAGICEVAGADVLSVVQSLKSDARIGARAFLSPGLGFAGGTLARDVQTLRRISHDASCPTPVLDGVLERNRIAAHAPYLRLRQILGDLNQRTIAVLGATYKPGTSTLRRSPALGIIRDLAGAGATVRVFDPKADWAELGLGFKAIIETSPMSAARGADALVVVTEWPEFKDLDFAGLRAVMKQPIIVDCKNTLSSLNLSGRGFQYAGVGR